MKLLKTLFVTIGVLNTGAYMQKGHIVPAVVIALTYTSFYVLIKLTLKEER